MVHTLGVLALVANRTGEKWGKHLGHVSGASPIKGEAWCPSGGGLLGLLVVVFWWSSGGFLVVLDWCRGGRGGGRGCRDRPADWSSR